MRMLPALALALALISLSNCSRTRLGRTPQESLMSTIREPLSRSCSTLESPADYCGIEALTKASSYSENQRQCVRFYQAAIDSANIQCSYQEELAYIHRAGALSRTDYITDRLRQIHIKYGKRAAVLNDELEEAYRDSQQWTDEQDLTYHNVAWSLRSFRSKIRLEKPRSDRQPASEVSPESLGRMPREETPELMRKLIIPLNTAH